MKRFVKRAAVGALALGLVGFGLGTPKAHAGEYCNGGFAMHLDDNGHGHNTAYMIIDGNTVTGTWVQMTANGNEYVDKIDGTVDDNQPAQGWYRFNLQITGPGPAGSKRAKGNAQVETMDAVPFDHGDGFWATASKNSMVLGTAEGHTVGF